MEHKENNTDNEEVEYLGNMWGWRLSFIGLGLIVFLVGIMVYRNKVLGVTYDTSKMEPTELSKDSLNTTKNE